MFLPRSLILLPYDHLRRTLHAQSPPVILLVALEPDALCAARILTTLFRRDFVPHQLVPIAGYTDLARAGQRQVRPLRHQSGGSGGIVICLGVGGLVDLGEVLGLDEDDEGGDPTGGVQVWILDARRPWNLGNVFDGAPPDSAHEGMNGNAHKVTPEVQFGEIQSHFGPGRGGVIVFDDQDIREDLEKERDAYFKLQDLPEIEDDGRESVGSESSSDSDNGGSSHVNGKKRKSWSDGEGDEDESDGGPPRRRRRSNSGSSRSPSPTRPGRRGLLSTAAASGPTDLHSSRPPSPSAVPTSHQPTSPPPDPARLARRNRRRLLRLKRQHEATLLAYYSRGTSYSEPVASLAYGLASALGRTDNDLLWHAVVGASSLELYGRTAFGLGLAAHHPDADDDSDRTPGAHERVLTALRDEVHRLNPPAAPDRAGGVGAAADDGVLPTTATGPTDRAIRLSPEPRFLLARHWSLYDAMLHSPYLAARLQLWSNRGVARLDKFLAVMGVSLDQSHQGYRYMKMDIRRSLRQKLLQYAPRMGLPGLVPRGVGVGPQRWEGYGFVRCWGWEACLSAADVAVIVGAMLEVGRPEKGRGAQDDDEPTNGAAVDEDGQIQSDEFASRFNMAYDALNSKNVSHLLDFLEPTQELHRAILRTGTHLIAKRQIRLLHTYRMGVVHDGPDVARFAHPGALTKLALWVAAAIAEQVRHSGAGGRDGGGAELPLVLAALNSRRGCYVVVGTGGGGVVKSGGGSKAREKAERRETRKAEKAKAREEKKRAKTRARRARKATPDDDEEEQGASEPDTESETESEPSEDDEDDGDDGSVAEPNGAEPAAPSVKRNRFGLAFQAVVEETGARVRIDSFEHCVVEVRKDDLKMFLEALSRRSCVG